MMRYVIILMVFAILLTACHKSDTTPVNPQSESITVLRLNDSGYEEAGTYRRGESAKSMLMPNFSLDVAAVFDSIRVK